MGAIRAGAWPWRSPSLTSGAGEFFYERSAVQVALDAVPDPDPVEEGFGPYWTGSGSCDDVPEPVPDPSPLDEPAAVDPGRCCSNPRTRAQAAGSCPVSDFRAVFLHRRPREDPK